MANYAKLDQGPELHMPGLKLSFLTPIWNAITKSPSTTIFAAAMFVSLSWAAANALFFQTGGHPAPLFVHEPTNVIENRVQPSAPARPNVTPPAPQTQSIPTVQTTDFGPTTGNPDAFFVQSRLFELGYFKEKVDGYYGPKTASAIREFEIRAGLDVTGAISEELMASLAGATTPKVPQAMPEELQPNADPLLQIAQNANTSSSPQSAATAELVTKVQKGLQALGYDVGKVDGILGETTSTAIRKFELFNNYDQTGQITPELIELLQKANPDF